MKNNWFLPLLLVLLVLPATGSLLRPGFFPSHDGEWMVIRLSDFHRSFVSGQIPVRFGTRLNHGFGYPVFNFLYPLSLYFGEAFHLLGFSFVWSIKAVFILSFLASAVFMYLLAREFWGKWGGLASALFYVYTPYRFLDVYVRGSIGEALAFVFPPLIFLAAKKLQEQKGRLWLVVGGFAFAGLVASHNSLAMLFAMLFIAYFLLRLVFFRQIRVFFRQILIFVLGLGLSCFFWLPALYDKRFVWFDRVVVSDFFAHFPSLTQLLAPRWGYGPSLPFSNQDALSFQIGILNLGIFLVLAGFFVFRFFRSRQREKFLRVNFEKAFFLVVFAFSFLLMLKTSSWLWQILVIFNLIQFPWRLLALTTFSSAFLAGGAVSLVKGKLQVLLLVFLTALVILASYDYGRPESFVNRGEDFYATNEATTTVANEYMPIWVERVPVSRASEKVEIVSGEGKIENLSVNSKRLGFIVLADGEVQMQVNTVYFPGWQVRAGSQKVPILFQNQEGLIRFRLPKGEHRVTVFFSETPLRLLADGVSLLSFLFAGGLLVTLRRKNIS